MTATVSELPDVGRSTELIAGDTADTCRVRYADGWLYLRRALTVYARALDGSTIYRRGLGLRPFSPFGIGHAPEPVREAFDTFAEYAQQLARGYGVCALWCDCMPAEPKCEDCGETIEPDPAGSEDVWHHSGPDGHDRNADHAPRPPEDYSDETGGREDLEPDAELSAHWLDQCAAWLAEQYADLLLYAERMGPWTGTDDRGHGTDSVMARAGHDYWLTRHGHGTGYWDRGLGELGERLTDAAKALGEDWPGHGWDNGDGTAVLA